MRWLRGALLAGNLSRAALRRGLCEQDEWRNPKGELCEASARKALPLPRFTGTLQELGAVRLRAALEPAVRQLCASLLEQEHPLGAGRAPGCRLSYVLEADCGVLQENSKVRVDRKGSRLG